VKSLSDSEIYYGIRNKDNDVLEYLYKKFFPYILKVVKESGGDEHDARDLFQDAVVAIYKQVRDDKVRIRESFSAYFTVMCRYLWYDAKGSNASTKEVLQTRLRDNVEVASEQEEPYEDRSKHIAGDLQLRREKIYQRCYRKLATDCKKVLTMFYRKHSYVQIACRMGYASSGYARRKKYLCWRHLMDLIKNDKEYKNLTEGRESEE